MVCRACDPRCPKWKKSSELAVRGTYMGVWIGEPDEGAGLVGDGDGASSGVEDFKTCYPNKWYRRYVLFLLFLIATLQTTDVSSWRPSGDE